MPQSSRKLILFTAGYPYGHGETFLENEVPVLANHFETLIIQPSSFQGGHCPRHVPPNAHVLPPLSPRGSLRKAAMSVANVLTHPVLRHELLRQSGFRSWTRLSACLVAGSYNRFMRNWLATAEPDLNDAILYFYWGRGAAYGIEDLRRRTAARIVVRLHGYDLFEDRNLGYIPLRTQVFEGADALCSVSDAGLRYLAQRYPDHAAKMRVSRLGTADHGVGHFEPKADELTVVSCANVISLKRIPLLAESLGRLPRQAIHWHHFGDGHERGEVERRIRTLPAHIRATLHGQVTNADVLEFYRSHHVDAFISVSETEGVPVTIMEATSFGIPVIATNVGGTAEILSDNGAVLLPPVFSQSQFENAILAVVGKAQDIELRSQIREHWRHVAHATHNYDAFVRDVLLGGE